MIKMATGALLGAVAMFLIGFVMFGTPISRLGYVTLDTPRQAAVQQALASNLPQTGTYMVPNPQGDAASANMYSRGPVATINYNMSGFGAQEAGAMISGFILNIIVALLIGFGLLGLSGRIGDFATRARLVILFSVAAAALIHLGRPIWMHHDWANALFTFIADALMLAAPGLIIARWFLPRSDAARPVPEAAPAISEDGAAPDPTEQP